MLKKSFKVNSEFYSAEHILTAIEDFKDVAPIEFDQENMTITISWDDDKDTIVTFSELMNYCLSIYNESI